MAAGALDHYPDCVAGDSRRRSTVCRLEAQSQVWQAWLPGGSEGDLVTDPSHDFGWLHPPPPPLLLSLLAPVRLSCETPPPLTQDEPLSRSLAALADMVSPEEVPVPGTGDEDVPTMHLTGHGFSACFRCCNKIAQTET